MIDIVKVRQAVNEGKLRCYISERTYPSETHGKVKHIYLQDCETEETVKIGEIEANIYV